MRSIAPLLTFLGLMCWLPAQAQSYLSPDKPRHAYDDRLRIEADLLYGSYTTQARLDDVVDTATGTVVSPGTVVSMEDDFGLPASQFMGQVEITALPSKYHLLRLNALSMRRNGHNTLTRNVFWDNDTYFVGERVDAHLNVTMVGMTYGYFLFHEDRYELAITGGLQFSWVSANAEVLNRVIREDETAAGIVPMAGLEGRFDITRRFSVDARYQYFDLSMIKLWGSVASAVGVDTTSFDDSLENKTGTITDARLAVRWRQNQHLVFGLAYRMFSIEVDAPDSDPAGAVVMDMKGPLLFMQVGL